MIKTHRRGLLKTGVITLRLTPQEAWKLEMLCRLQRRSKSSVLAWLLNQADDGEISQDTFDIDEKKCIQNLKNKRVDLIKYGEIE